MGCSLRGHGGPPASLGGTAWGVQEADPPCECRTALTGSLLAKMPSGGPSLSAAPPQPGLAWPGEMWGPGGWRGWAARKEPLTHSYRKSGAGGARSTNCPPAGAGVGAWVGFKFRRGCDCKARKLQESSD